MLIGICLLAPLVAPLPPLSDRDLFPAAAYCAKMGAFNRDYRAHLDKVQWVYSEKHWLYTRAIRECDQAWDVWEKLYGWGSEQAVRMALAELRELIGNEAYYSGRLPAPVPLWSFTPID